MKTAVEKVTRRPEGMLRTSPVNRMEELMREVERFWERSFPFRLDLGRLPELRAPEYEWSPRIDLWEKEGELVLHADLPGMKKSEIEIFFEEGDLVLNGERKVEKKVEEENVYRTECFHGTFHRRIPLGFEIDPKLVAAKFENGVLELKVPMPPKTKPEPKKIAIG